MHNSVSTSDYFKLEQCPQQVSRCKSGAPVSMYEFDRILTGDNRSGFFLYRIGRNKSVPENFQQWMTPAAIKKWIVENERDVFEDIINFKRFYAAPRRKTCKK